MWCDLSYEEDTTRTLFFISFSILNAVTYAFLYYRLRTELNRLPYAEFEFVRRMYRAKFIIFFFSYIITTLLNVIHVLDLLNSTHYFILFEFIVLTPYPCFLFPIMFLMMVHWAEYKVYKRNLQEIEAEDSIDTDS